MEDNIPKTQCIKVDSLRKKFKDKDISLEKWMNMPGNLYVGRRGRIFINGEIFHYKDSKWGNPFTLKNYSIDKSLELYKNHILNSKLKDELIELNGMTLGCFCDQSGKCHAKVLVELYILSKKGDAPSPTIVTPLEKSDPTPSPTIVTPLKKLAPLKKLSSRFI